jgi:hypothetical protein
MRRVINGQRWDTDKANLVCEVVNGMPRDLDYVKVGLYQTPRSKRFFLAGEGGPMTVFAHCDGDRCCGGERIIPIDTKVARWLAEVNAPEETVKKFFVIKEA